MLPLHAISDVDVWDVASAAVAVCDSTGGFVQPLSGCLLTGSATSLFWKNELVFLFSLTPRAPSSQPWVLGTTLHPLRTGNQWTYE